MLSGRPMLPVNCIKAPRFQVGSISTGTAVGITEYQTNIGCMQDVFDNVLMIISINLSICGVKKYVLRKPCVMQICECHCTEVHSAFMVFIHYLSQS